MRSSLPKMLHPVCGRPMVAWPIIAAREAGAGEIAAIISPGHDLTDGFPGEVSTVVQPQADGTGGAIRAAHDLIKASDTVVVLSGDVPLISAETISSLLATHPTPLITLREWNHDSWSVTTAPDRESPRSDTSRAARNHAGHAPRGPGAIAVPLQFRRCWVVS